jgi:hypothetical protein
LLETCEGHGIRAFLGLSVVVAVLVHTACLPRARVNLNCEWGDERVTRLNVKDAADSRHLSADAHLADDLAIRYADLYPSTALRLRPGFRLPRNANDVLQERAACFAKLSNLIANIHGVTLEQVHEGLERRDLRVDLATVGGPMVLFFGFIAHFVVGRLYRNLRDRTALAVIMTVFASIAVTAMMVMLGEMWTSMVEMIRLGNGHLTPTRVRRIPWVGLRTELFACGVLMFWCIAVFRWREGRGAAGPD